MYDFLSGAIAMASFAAAFVFMRFHRKVEDRFFLFFAAAFAFFGLERVVLIIIRGMDEHYPQVYLIRLLGFVLIIAAILDKNKKDSLKQP